MFYTKININGTEYPLAVNITGVGAPTASTAAEVGMFYMDTSTGDVYKCTAVSGSTYTWKPLIEIVQTPGDSETDAMSQKAVTDELDSVVSGVYHLKGGFKHGSIAGSGADDDTVSFRIKSLQIIKYGRDVHITIENDFKCAIHLYNDNGDHTTDSGWVTKEYTIPANTPFRVVIARNSENTAETADIDEFKNALVVSTAISDVIKKAEKTRILNDEHITNNEIHLKNKVVSDNLVDVSQMIDGGYYSYANGSWVTRADMCSTGLISCEKGQVFYFGRGTTLLGGNATFWNATNEFVSGLNVTSGLDGLTIPDNDDIRYFRISVPTWAKATYQVNLGAYAPYDEYATCYAFDKEIVTPSFDSLKKENPLYYAQNYKDDVTVLHKRNEIVGTTYQVTIINKTKFDGTATKVTIEGTSPTSQLGDGNNTRVPVFANSRDLLHVINGGIFLAASGEADGITIINGEILKSTGVEQFTAEQYVLGITADGTFKTYINETAANILADGSVYAFTAFVPLIQNGAAVSGNVLAVCPHYNVRHPRQIVGTLKDGNYFTFCCDGRTDGENGMTLQECINTLLSDFAVEFAFNLDGGGSTQSVVGKKEINRRIDGRTVPNVIVFK